MREEEIFNVGFVLGCSKCQQRWDVLFRNANVRLKHFQSFLNVNCVNCGSDNSAIAIVGIDRH